MNCRKAKDKMNAMLDSQLSATDSAEIRAHIAGCPECQHALRSLQQVNAFLGSYTPAAFTVSLEDRILAAAMSVPTRQRFPKRYGFLSMAASMAGAVLLGIYLAGQTFTTETTITTLTAEDYYFGAEAYKIAYNARSDS